MSKPSQGAMNAAIEIDSLNNSWHQEMMQGGESPDASKRYAEIAAIIDEETGVAELLDVCKAFVLWDDREKDDSLNENDYYQTLDLVRDAFRNARAAIAKAEVKP